MMTAITPLKFSSVPLCKFKGKYHEIFIFDFPLDGNIDQEVVKSFGQEWKKFHRFSNKDIEKNGRQYFDILNENIVNEESYVLDVGCGTGRWTKYLVDKVGFVEAVDPSDAIYSADFMLKDCKNIRLSKASIESLPFQDDAFDFVMSIGVLHHIPDTASAMRKCVKKAKIGGHFYVYLYYDVSQRGILFKFLFKIANIVRQIISRMSGKLKRFFCDLIAVVFYMPFVIAGRFLSFLGFKKIASKKPLHFYQNQSFYIIRNDALDRFGTKLEHRFSKQEVIEMMANSGLNEIIVSEKMPFWHAVGKRKY